MKRKFSMKMKTRAKIVTSIIALVLSCVLLFTVMVVNNNTNQVVGAATRTVELSASTIDAQSILNEFDDAKLTKKGTTTYFEGYKAIDKDKLSEIDYISEDDFAELEECTVKYNFSYDSETNIVTLAACATLPDGSIDVDEITGVGFLNENNEIDAVMNIDGDAVLLSEMRSAGMIENCGWFSRILKTIAISVAVVAVAVAAVAAVVVTAGAAAPAVVAAGIGVSTTVVAGAVATATTIATVSLTVAAIAAGVAIATSVVELVFEGVQYKLIELTDTLRYELQNGLYYLAVARTDTGAMLVSTVSVTKSVAASAMKAGLSCYNYSWNGAYEVAKLASDGLTPVHDYAHKVGYFNHYHRYDRKGVAHAFYGAPQF